MNAWKVYLNSDMGESWSGEMSDEQEKCRFRCWERGLAYGSAKLNVALLSGCVGICCGFRDTICEPLSEGMRRPIWSLRRQDMHKWWWQGVGSSFIWGLERRKFVTLFLDNISALWLLAHAICSMAMRISNIAVKNHRDLSRLITMWALEEPLVIATTSPRLSHWNSTVFLLKEGPNTAELITIGTSSLAIIPTDSHSLGHF